MCNNCEKAIRAYNEGKTSMKWWDIAIISSCKIVAATCKDYPKGSKCEECGQFKERQ